MQAAYTTPTQNNFHKSTSPLQVGMEQYWFDDLRPFIKEQDFKLKTDPELVRTLESVVNHIDSKVKAKDIEGVKESYVTLVETLSDPSYYKEDPVKSEPQEEKNITAKILEKFNDFSMILKYENVEETADPEPTRLNYKENPDGQGENMDYDRTVESLAKPIQLRDRLPNV